MEEWRSIVGHEGEYEVSNLGRVRSLDRVVMQNRKDGLRPWYYKGRILKQTPATHGYLTVRLQGAGACVHTLVLTAFVGSRPFGHECRHLDGNRLNAKLSNLCWGTQQQNRDDAERHGTTPCGEIHWHAKLTEKAVREIRSSHLPTRILAQQIGVDTETVRRARRGESWRRVT